LLAAAAIGDLFSEVREVEPGEVLIRQGQLVLGLFRLRSGGARVTVADDSGVRPIAHLGAGDWVGEMSLLTGEPAGATVTALTACRLDFASRARIEEALDRDPSLARELAQLVSMRLLRTLRPQPSVAQRLVPVFHPSEDPHVGRRVAEVVAAAIHWHLACRAALVAVSSEGSAPGNAPGGQDLFELLASPDLTAVLGYGAAPPALADIRASLGSRAPSELDGALFRLVDGSDYVVAALSPDLAAALPRSMAQVQDCLTVGLGATWTRTVRDALGSGPVRLHAVAADGPRQPTCAQIERLAARHGCDTAHVLPGIESLRDPVERVLRRQWDDALARNLGRLARGVCGSSVGLALGSGGTRGFAHVGALDALRRLHVPVDYVAGSSIGAVVGGLMCLGRSQDEIMEWLAAMKRKAIRLTLPLRSVFGGSGIATHARAAGAGGAFEDALTPFAAVATDLHHGRETVFRRGAMWPPVLASSSIPGLYPPVKLNGRWYVDGGVSNPVPVNVARALGADRVLGIKLQYAEPGESQRRRAPRLTETLLRSIGAMQDRITDYSAAEADLVLAPSLPAASGAFGDFARAAELRRLGDEAIETAAPALRHLLPWLQ
jgi:NTE family protein